MKDKVTNYYKIIPKDYIKSKASNPNYKNNLISDPVCRILIVGASGSGKTQNVMEWIKRTSGAYYKIYIICPNNRQPLYQWLSDMLGDSIEILPNMNDLAPPKELEPIGYSKLIIFDDMVAENKNVLKKISDYYIQGRHGLCAVMFLSQSFFDIPKIIRLNTNYILIRQLGNFKDIPYILKTYSPKDIDTDKLKKIYEYATSSDDPDEPSFLMIDLNKPNQLFRRNFLEIIDINSI